MNAIAADIHAQTQTTKPTNGTLTYALDVVGAMGDAGMTPVPLKPSATMLASGSRAGGVSVEVAWKIYLAMIREAA